MTGKHRTWQAGDQLARGPAGTEEAEKGMPTCPAGHTSASSDFCDVCGMRIGAAASVQPQEPQEPQPQETAEPCPHCGAARSGRFCESCGFDFDAGGAPAAAVPGGDGGSRERTIEGVIVPPPGTGPAAPAAPPPPPAAPIPATAEPVPASAGDPAAWTAVVASDREYFEDVVAAGGPDSASLTFPDYCPERRFRLAGPEMRIGRRSASQGLEPEIDLTGPPTDPGVSRMHAALIAEPDGSWTVLDPGSENGTLVNGAEIAAGMRVPLHDGDRICLGAWTVITIRAS
jgi:FHA domain